MLIDSLPLSANHAEANILPVRCPERPSKLDLDISLRAWWLSFISLCLPLHVHLLFKFFPEWHFQSLSNHSCTSTIPASPLSPLSFLSFSFFLVHLALFQWPCSHAAGLYLVRPMIKSAGLTSASDRPIHPTDTPLPPHMGRLNNLCTISNMKEDLLTLAPFPIVGLLRKTHCSKPRLFALGLCACRHQTLFPTLPYWSLPALVIFKYHRQESGEGPL